MDANTGTYWMFLLLVGVCTLGCGGCFIKRHSTVFLGNVTLAHPSVPAATTEATLVEPPDIPVDPTSMPPHLAPPRSGPSKPRVAQPPVTEPVPVEKVPSPIILPELSDEQVAVAKRASQNSLDVAERNLALTQGRRLSSAQEDLVSKVRGFMDSAREAMRNGDWQRATNLAKKAEVLAQELAGNP
jgi:hypothetical protein